METRPLLLAVLTRNPQSPFYPTPHALDRNLHTGSVAATAAITIDAAIEVETLDYDVVRRERPVASRRGRAEDRHNRRPGRRRDVHRPRVSAGEDFRHSHQRRSAFA